MRKPKTFFIRTYGCQMNENDSELLIGALENRGLTRTDLEQEADLLLYNTCSIRDLAERKVMGKIGLLGRGSRRNAIIGVTGCMANAKKDSLFRKLPHVDFVLGTNNIHQLDEVLDEVLTQNRQVCRTDRQFHTELDYSVARRDNKIKAYVTIIRGCNKFCTYCVVPYTRGQEVSRAPESILEECRRLVDAGYKEITLLGQNVNSYGLDKKEWNCTFPSLLEKIGTIPGLERVRFMTSHPYDITRELMEVIRDVPTLCRFVHFPIQAGSDRVLRKMHRMYTVEEYKEKVQLFRSIVPDVQLGTDIIVGFPTETEEEFMGTYRAMEELEFSMAFLFAYSPRQGTPAKRWKDDIPEEVKQDRLQRLMELQDRIYAKQRERLLGEIMTVLVERPSAKDPSMMRGRTDCWKKVVFPGDSSLVGTLQPIRVTGFTHQTLLGELVTSDLKTGTFVE